MSRLHAARSLGPRLAPGLLLLLVGAAAPARADHLFASASLISAAPGVVEPTLTAADVDGDGDLDLLFLDGTDLRVLRNRGDGTFFAPTEFATGLSATGPRMAVGDVTGDGRPDTVHGAGPSLQQASVLVNLGAGTFTPVLLALPRASGALPLLGDADADGDLDIFFVGAGVTTYRNDGGGAFTLTSDRASSTTTAPHEAAIGDLDGDGRDDLVVAALDDADGIDLLFAGPDPLTGQAGIATVQHVFTGLDRSALLALGDMDSDGDLDVVLHGGLLGSESAGARVIRNDGSRQFTLRPLAASLPREGVAQLVLADATGGGDLDAIVTCGDAEGSCRSLLLHAGDGTGRLEDARPVPVTVAADRAHVADLDCDGDLDLVGGAAGVTTVLVSASQFEDELAFPVGGADFVLADLDDDGQPDAALLDASGLRVALGTGCATSEEACTSTPPIARAGADVVECVSTSGVREFQVSAGASTPGTSPIARFCFTTDTGFFVESDAAFHCSALSTATLRMGFGLGDTRARVAVEVADFSGCRSTDEVVVGTDSAPVITLGGPVTGTTCLDGQVVLQARAVDTFSPAGLVTFEWDLDIARDSSGNGIPDDDVDATIAAVSGSIATLSATFTRVGTISMRVVARGTSATCTVSRDASVVVTQPPNVTAVQAPVNTCPGVAARFVATVTGGTAPTVTWDFDARVDLDGNGNAGDDIQASGLDVDWVFATGGLVTVRATARDGACSAIRDRDVNVFPPVTASFTSDSPSCDSGVITFRDTSTGGTAPLSVSWDFGDGQQATGLVVTHVFERPGAHVITQTIFDGRGCSTTRVQTVAVQAAALRIAGVTLLDGQDGVGTGDRDGFADPGERVRLRVDVQDLGSAPVTDASVSVRVIQPLAGVTVTDGSATLPTILPGAIGTTSLPHLEINLAPSVRCGTFIVLEITATGFGSTGCTSVDEVRLRVGLPELVRFDLDRRVTETHGRAIRPDAAALEDHHVIVFQEAGEGGIPQVHAAGLLSSGTIIAAPTRLSLPSIVSTAPRVTAAPEARQFGVAWREDLQGGSRIAFQRLDAGGSPLGAPIRLSVSQRAGEPDVTWTGEHYVMAWPELGYNGARAIHAVTLGPDGLPLSAPQLVSAVTDEGIADHGLVRLAASGGSWHAAFTREDGPTTLRVRTFADSGVHVLAPLSTISLGEVPDEAPALDAFSGGAVVAFTPGGGGTIELAFIDGTGVLRTREAVGAGRAPALAVGPDMGVVAWETELAVVARGVARTGGVFGPTLVVSNGEGSSQFPTVSAAGDGLFLAAWSDLRVPHPDAPEIYAAVIQPSAGDGCQHVELGDLAPLPGGDGDVDVGDVIVALRVAVGLEPVTADILARGDVGPGLRNGNIHDVIGDGRIDIGDVVVLLQAATGNVQLR